MGLNEVWRAYASLTAGVSRRAGCVHQSVAEARLTLAEPPSLGEGWVPLPVSSQMRVLPKGSCSFK